jgi:hypothetical protein
LFDSEFDSEKLNMTMKRPGEELKRACRVGASVAPGPLIGITGPYGILSAGVGYGGYLLFKRLKSRG